MITDRATHAQGISLDVGKIVWLGATRVRVSGGYTEAPLSSAGYEYDVALRGKRWVVTSARNTWIS